MVRKHRSLSLSERPFRFPRLLGLALVLVTASPAAAQLRIGSTSRSLYQRDAKTARISDAELSDESESNELDQQSGVVVAASHQQLHETSGRTSNQAINQPARQVRSRGKSSGQVVPAGCTSCGNGGNGRLVQSFGSGSVIEAPSAMMDGEVNSGMMHGGSYQSGASCSDCDSFGCDSGCMSPCDSDCVSPLQSLLRRLSIRAEVPLFWRTGQSTPPLVSTGELGQNTTQILRSGAYDKEVHAGVRINLSTWLDDCQQRGVMFRYWNAGTFEENTLFSSDNHPTLARPFFNTTVAGSFANDTLLVASPGDSTGSIGKSTRSQVYGLDLVLRRLAYADRFTRFDWVYGYHHTLIGEQLNIASQTTVTANGQSISVADNFQTRNRLHGFTAGFMSTRRIACYQLETMFRLTMGNLQRQVDINGQTTTVSGGTSNTTSQGLLARNTNARSLIDNTFVLAPEVGVNLAYALNSNMDFSIGYNYMMIPKVAQASRQIDPGLRVNLSDPLTGSADPAFRFHTSRYWVSSLGLGLQIRY